MVVISPVTIQGRGSENGSNASPKRARLEFFSKTSASESVPQNAISKIWPSSVS